jgi:hypothetical protein
MHPANEEIATPMQDSPNLRGHIQSRHKSGFNGARETHKRLGESMRILKLPIKLPAIKVIEPANYRLNKFQSTRCTASEILVSEEDRREL